MQLTIMNQESDTKFEKYHSENPHIYQEFERVTLQAIEEKRFKHFGAKAIFEQIRWNTGISATGDYFKVNNIYTPHYARLFEKRHPHYKGFFRQRKSNSDSISLNPLL